MKELFPQHQHIHMVTHCTYTPQTKIHPKYSPAHTHTHTEHILAHKCTHGHFKEYRNVISLGSSVQVKKTIYLA